MARIVRGVLVRLLYCLYLALAAAMVVVMHEGRITGSPHWIITVGVAALVIEFIVTIRLTQGFDWKWFSPCTVIFSAAGLYSVWAAQLRTLSFHDEGVYVCLNQTFTDEVHNLNASLVTDWLDLCICGNCNGGAEQLFILMLILGKYLLPKGVSFYNPNDNINNFLDSLTKTHYLLAVTCNGADLMDMISYTRLPGIYGNTGVISIIMILFSIGLVQFNINSFATMEEKSSDLYIIVETDLWSSLVTLMTDDLPFMIMRIYLLATYKSFSPFGVFFLIKNFMYISLTLHKGVLICTGKDMNEIEEYVTSIPYTPQLKRKTISRLGDTPDGLDDISDQQSVYSNEIPVKSRNDARKPDVERENTEVDAENVGDWGDEEQWFSNTDMKEESLPVGQIPADWDVESQIGSQTNMSRVLKANVLHQRGFFTENYAEDREAEMDVSKIGSKHVLRLPLGKTLIGGQIDFTNATPPPTVNERREDSALTGDSERKSKAKKSKKKKETTDEVDIDKEINDILDDNAEKKQKKKKKDREVENGEEEDSKSKKKKKKKTKSREEEDGSGEEKTEKKHKKEKKHKEDDFD